MERDLLYGIYEEGTHRYKDILYFRKKEINDQKFKIIGSIDLKKCPLKQVGSRSALACGTSFYLIKNYTFGITRGFIKVEGDGYLKLKVRKPIYYTMLALLSICTLVFFAYKYMELNELAEMKIQDVQDIKLKEPVKNEQGIPTTSIKFFDNPNISVDKQTYAFHTGDANQVLLQAEIVKDGNVIASSDLVKPNDYISFNMYELLENGTHDLQVNFYQYNILDMTKTNFALTQDFTIHVSK